MKRDVPDLDFLLDGDESAAARWIVYAAAALIALELVAFAIRVVTLH